MGTKVTFLVSIRVNRATIEFKEGMGVGVLASQEMTFDLPDDYSPHHLAASLRDAGERLLEETVKIDVDVVW